MLAVWSRHLAKDPKAKLEFEDYVKNSTLLINRLQDILTSIEDSLEKNEISPDAFDNANWAYKQAYANGCKATIQKIKLYTDLNSLKDHNDPIPNK